MNIQEQAVFFFLVKSIRNTF